jgi:hypothetical protein
MAGYGCRSSTRFTWASLRGSETSALTTGFSSAFAVAGLFAIAGFVAALVAVRH